MMIGFVPEDAWKLVVFPAYCICLTEDFYMQYMAIFSFGIISNAQMAISSI